MSASTYCIVTFHVLFAGLVTVASSVVAADLQPGDKAPEFQNLAGIDGKTYSSKDFSETEVLVICFTCNRCPYAVDYEERLVALHESFQTHARRVRLIAVNSNSGPSEDLEKMKKRAERRGFQFACLKDEDQNYARALGAVYTPEFFVLNREREVVYKGALDDSTRADTVQEKYVEQAVKATLQNQPIAVEAVGARGCTIRFRRHH